jgi:hypothetical protein
MSHLTASSIIITDIDILKKAVAGFHGLTWNEGATTYRWYVNDKERKKELEAEQGQCEHSISIAGSRYGYEVGVVRRKDGEGYSLVFDSHDTAAADKIGAGCEKIIAAYGEAYTRDFAEKHGFICEQSTDEEGNIVLTMIDNG